MKRWLSILLLASWSVLVAPARADLPVADGNFTKRSGTGAQNVTHSGSFTGKVVLFWGSKVTAVGASANASEFFGASSGSAAAQNRCMASYNVDNVATSDSATRLAANAISILSDTVPTIVGAAVVTAFNSGSFDLDWTTSDANAYIIYFKVIGGTDLTNVLVGEKAWGVVTGNQSFTGVGFQPNFIFINGNGDGTASATNRVRMRRGYGAALSTSNRWAVTTSADDADAMDPYAAGRRLVVTEMASNLNGAGSSVSKGADFVTFDTDGWTWNITTASAGADLFFFVAFKFADVTNNVAIGTFTHCTATDCTSDVTTGQGAVKGLLLFSRARSSDTVIIDDADLSIGGSDFTNEGSVVFKHRETTGGNTQVNQYIASDKVMLELTPTVEGVLADAADASAISNGFRTTWTTNGGVGHVIAYISFGEAAAGAPAPKRLPLLNVGDGVGKK